MSDPFRVDGKVALVAGGTRGIGLAAARTLLSQGARVAVASEDPAAVQVAVGQLGQGVYGIVADVEDTPACARAVEEAVGWGSRLDILICAAGITGRAGPTAGLDLADYERVMAINLRGMVALAGAAMPHLAATQGSAVLVGSIAASRGNGAINAYALAKAGVLQLARNLAVEWGPRNVRVNSLSPGLVATGFSAPLLADEGFMARRMAMTPLRRPGTAEEVAAAIAFLASPAAGFVTGHDLVVDGGTLITDGS